MKNRIKELRCEKGLRQEDLAEAINVSQQTVSRMENGKNSLPADILVHLSLFFQVSVDYILNLTDSRHMWEGRKADEKMTKCSQEFIRGFERLNSVNRNLINNLMTHLQELQNKV